MAEHPQVSGSRSPQTVADARRAVEASRQRISETLDELEDRLVEKKQALHRRLDVARPARRFVEKKPLAGVAMAAGVGLLLGVLGSRRKDQGEFELGDPEVAAIRRWRRERRKRLLGAAEDELPDFDPPPSRARHLLRDMTHELAGAATALVIAALIERVRNEGPAIVEQYPLF